MEGLPITKIAINSTLGTDDFQSLDEIIRSQRTLVASDTPYKLVTSSWTAPTDASTLPKSLSKTITSTVDGSIKLTGKINAGSAHADAGANLYFDDTLIATSVSSSDTSFATAVAVKKGSQHTIRFYCKGTQNKIKDLYICADMVDGSLIQLN